ncbi:hypothetical protein RvY_06578-2 [Ramazzottius varieornatus]|uniref:Uncharacterized protein n=1 Tax=Ramazzottius varieornatus TaxID=947166 RepID=A0A1D1UZ36_RAMVA|nr:hypothetical protein RvY_06578-2 [Ramazzottius varieornatus]
MQQVARRGKRVRKWNAEQEDGEYEAFQQHHQCNKKCAQLTKDQYINRLHSLFDLSRSECYAVLIGFLVKAFPRDKSEDDFRQAKYSANSPTVSNSAVAVSSTLTM